MAQYRCFVDSIALIYGDINYEFEDDAVTITVGSGDFTKSGKFYYDGKADIPIDSGEKYNTATIAQNVDGKLYMERTDFYKAMDISYAVYESEYTVSDSGLIEDFGFNLVIGAAAMYTGAGLWGSAVLSTAASSIKSALSPPSGNYKSHVIVAEVYSTHLDEYYQLYTLDSLMYDGDNDGYYVETMYEVINTVDDFGTPTSQLANIKKGILP